MVAAEEGLYRQSGAIFSFLSAEGAEWRLAKVKPAVVGARRRYLWVHPICRLASLPYRPFYASLTSSETVSEVKEI